MIVITPLNNIASYNRPLIPFLPSHLATERRECTDFEKEDMNDKIILDASCGSRMFWFDRNNPLAVYADIRSESHVLCDGRDLHVKPDVISDFKNMPFKDESFKLVIFDPPHLKKIGVKSWMFLKYGSLTATWQDDLKAGVNECMRVLEPNGVLIFKWNEAQINLNQVLKAIDHKPLFGHVTGKHGKTIWLCFMKLAPSNTGDKTQTK